MGEKKGYRNCERISNSPLLILSCGLDVDVLVVRIAAPPPFELLMTSFPVSLPLSVSVCP